MLLERPAAVDAAIRYFAPTDVARADGRHVQGLRRPRPASSPTARSSSVPVKVSSPTPGSRSSSVAPRYVNVQLDPLTQRDRAGRGRAGVPPTGLTVGPIDVEPKQVTVEGAKSLVDKVVGRAGSVVIRARRLDVDQDVDLIPVDSVGNRVGPVDLSPRFVHVTMPVFYRPPVPDPAGEAGRHRHAGARVRDRGRHGRPPTVVTVEGDADPLEPLVRVDTMPVSINGRVETP